MFEWILIAGLFHSQTAKVTPKPGTPIAALTAPKPLTSGSFSVYASPSSISFAATNPDTPTVAGSGTTTVSWNTSNSANDPWKLQVSANAASFSSCPTAVPASAVTITCTGGFNPGPGGFSCASAKTLSTTAKTVASGTLPYAGSTYFYVTLTYALTDQWKYIAQTSSSCTLDMTYTATVN
jgi:hypothetical protein